MRIIRILLDGIVQQFQREIDVARTVNRGVGAIDENKRVFGSCLARQRRIFQGERARA